MFTPEFMKSFQKLWNEHETISSTLKSINFTANVGYGIKGEETPKTVLVIQEGQAIDAREYKEGDVLDWDIRCSTDNWDYYLTKGISVASLASAYTMGYMKFIKGDYFSMIKNPSMIGPFIKSFDLMSTVYKEQKQ